MPRIEWRRLPSAVREHLRDRVRTRAIAAQDLVALLTWINTEPDLPDGTWCKDFGSFKLVGEGAIPKTFLTRPSVLWATGLKSRRHGPQLAKYSLSELLWRIAKPLAHARGSDQSN
jgi:hypothetical protein